MSERPSPRVTVVIPALNASRWIGEALASVIAQTYPTDGLEVVVVDDGSDDDTSEVSRRALESSRIRHAVLRNAKALGPSAARNRGYRHGTGNWIQFLDADDRLAPSKIADQMSVLDGAAAPVAGAFSRWARIYDDGTRWVEELPGFQPAIGADPLLDLLAADNFLQLGCLLLSRHWLERVGGFDESRHLIEDVELLLRIVIAGGTLRSVASPVPLSFYRMRDDSLSRSSDRQFVDGCVKNGQLVEEHCRHREDLTPDRAEKLADLYFFAARYYAEHDRQAFDAIVRDIYHLSPGFVPKEPRSLRLLSELLGYRAAEWLAVRRRQFKRAFHHGNIRDKEYAVATDHAVRR